MGKETWTENDIKELIEQWNAGRSASEIEIVLQRSRNSIIGKLDRLRRDEFWAPMITRDMDKRKAVRAKDRVRYEETVNAANPHRIFWR